MKKGQWLWTRDELLLAINLYAKIPFGTMHSRNPKIIELSGLINRSPGAVAWKLVNFASLDPSLKKRNIKGAENISNLDEEIWDEFHTNWDATFEKSEELLAKYKHVKVQDLYPAEPDVMHEKGLDRQRLVRVRLNQYRFRQLVLSNYSNTCCITGIKLPQLLIASHITSWSKFEHNRLNPANGLCLNALHDKAFDNGLITVNATDYKIRISRKLKSSKEKNLKFITAYDGKALTLPKKFLPDKQFLNIHNVFFEEIENQV